MKTCGVCRQVKPVEEFNRDRTRKDGLSSKCKLCDRAAVKASEQRHPEALRERRKRKLGTEATKAANKRARPRTEKTNAWEKASDRRSRDELRDRYIRNLLLRAGVTSPPADLIDLKREQLSIRRLAKELNEELANQLEK